MDRIDKFVAIILIALVIGGIALIWYSANGLLSDEKRVESEEQANREVITNLKVPILEARFNSPQITIVLRNATEFSSRAKMLNATQIFLVGTDTYVVVDANLEYAWQYNPTVYVDLVGWAVLMWIGAVGFILLPAWLVVVLY